MRILLFCLISLALTGSAFAQHASDIWVGQSSTGQLGNAGRDLAAPVYLPPTATNGPLGGGSALNDPGFDNVVVPADGLLPLAASADISFEVLSMTPGMRMISPNLSTVVDGAGQTGSLGGSDLHVHWHFHVFGAENPNFEDHAHYSCTLKLVDNSGAMADSEPFTIVFQTEDVIMGDVNLDGTLDALDLDEFNVVVADPTAASSAARVAADMNLDGVVDMNDLCELTVTLGLGTGFIRGDANEDLGVNIADAITMLGILFGGEQAPTHPAAVDANSDNQFNIADAVYLLGYLFSDGDAPAAPFVTAGCP